jgi:hypothetical protein
MSVATAQSPPSYISGNQARLIMGAGWYALQKAAMTGRVRIKADPGTAVKYCREDVERLRREAKGA